MEQRRRYIRFQPDPNSFALLDFEHDSAEDFDSQSVALIADEAPMGGCGLITLRCKMEAGQKCLVKVGQLSPLPAIVRWVRILDEEVSKVGLQFLE